MWRKNTDDKYVLDALDNGVELPFRDGVAPPPYRANRNHIAEDDMDWAREAIVELERHGAVKRWDVLRREVLAATGKDVGAHPHAVMPLIVADKSSSTPEKRMRRLIHDCRYINGFLNMEFKKFTLEQLRDFVKTLKAGDRLITIDITAAYHHVSIADRFRTFLGFEFEGVEYVYCVLPFGLSVSAYAFCKFVSVAASMIRRSGLAESLNNYMDDFVANMGESGEPAEAIEVVAEVESLGFLINWVKTNTNPETRVTALGFVLDTVLMEFEVPERRLVKLKAIAQLVLESEPGVRVRDLCKLTGQIWALQPALGLVCRLKSNYITRVAMPGLRQQDYNMRVQLVGRARAEVELWASDLDHLPRMPFHKHLRIPDLVLECDASASAVAGIVFLSPGGSGIELGAIHRELSAAERAYSSCLREMLGYAHTVRTLSQRYGARLRGLVIEIVGDSKAASFVFGKGASQAGYDASTDELMVIEALLDILGTAEAGAFEVVFRWVPRERIVGADALSKVADAMDFGLERDVFAHVNRTYGPCDVDRFAAGHNRVCPRFNSKFDTDGSEAVDAFSVSWSRGVSYVLPDFYPDTLRRVLDKIERDNAAAVVVVPEWDYYPFWHHLWSASFQRRVVRHEWVAGHCLVDHPEHTAECFFHWRDRLSGRRLDEGRAVRGARRQQLRVG